MTCLGQEFISYLFRAIVFNFTFTAAFVLWILTIVQSLHQNHYLSFSHNNCDSSWTVHFRMTWRLEENFMEGFFFFCGSRLKPSLFEKNHAAISRWISHIAYTGLSARCSCAVLDRGFDESRSMHSMPKWLEHSTAVGLTLCITVLYKWKWNNSGFSYMKRLAR